MRVHPSIYMKVRQLLKDLQPEKGLLILGYGREGKSSFDLFRTFFPELMITVADRNEQIRDDEQLRNDGHVKLLTGADYLNDLDAFPVVIKSPGISLKAVHLVSSGVLITSQTDLFLSMFGRQVTGITGTKGKSTTTSLIHHIIIRHNPEAVICGNIGVPPFDILADLTDHTPVVMEISGHQLEYGTASPHVAILLNLYQEHLDHFTSFKAYQASKLNIARYQSGTDYLIYNQDDPLVRSHIDAGSWNAGRFAFAVSSNVDKGCYERAGDVFLKDECGERMIFRLADKAMVRGKHNVLNILAACLAAHFNGVPFDMIAEGVMSFRPLRHRLEEVGTYHGISFFNDSISTIPEATIQALETLGEVHTLILGGYDRGIDYNHLVTYLKTSDVKHFILTGDAGQRMMELLYQAGVDHQRLHILQSFEDCIKVVREVTKPGAVCLLSPAAASYNEFRNFEERGDRFIELIKKG